MSTFINIQEIFLNIEEAKNRARRKLQATIDGIGLKREGIHMYIFDMEVLEDKIIFRFEDGTTENPNVILIPIDNEEHLMTEKRWEMYLAGMMLESQKILENLP